jgi:hypothetical protein
VRNLSLLVATRGAIVVGCALRGFGEVDPACWPAHRSPEADKTCLRQALPANRPTVLDCASSGIILEHARNFMKSIASGDPDTASAVATTASELVSALLRRRMIGFAASAIPGVRDG